MLYGVGAAAWWRTIDGAQGMSSMALGRAQLGTAMPFDMNPLAFLGTWTTMMAAMMLPTVACRAGGNVGRTLAFGSGYLLVWASTGVVALALLVAFGHLPHATVWTGRAGGGLFVLAGSYQFSRWKRRCLEACRIPRTTTLRLGLSNGLRCLGSCWALMALLLVVGVMSLGWMAALAVVFSAEKNWRHGVGVARVVGVTAVGLGIAMLLHPPSSAPSRW
jgi:predicted metal-binding membrane protein